MNSFLRQLFELVKVQFREFFREPEILFWAIAFPIAMAWVLGIAFSGEDRHTYNAALVYSGKGITRSDGFLNKALTVEKRVYGLPGDSRFSLVSASGRDSFVVHRHNSAEARKLLISGKVSLILEDYGDSLHYVFDARNSEAKMGSLILHSIIGGTEKSKGQSFVSSEVRGTRYIDFLIPGLLALNIMSSVLWAIGYSLIEKRSKKVLRRMVATPMSKTAFLMSFILGRVVIGVFETLVLLVFAYVYFGFVITGSIAAFIALYLASHICFSGIAIVIASRTEKPQFGNALINLVYLPMSICSGVFFSYNGFPSWLLPIIEKLPLTLMTDGFRVICNQGGGFNEVITPVILLSVSGCITFILGLRFYRWY